MLITINVMFITIHFVSLSRYGVLGLVAVPLDVCHALPRHVVATHHDGVVAQGTSPRCILLYILFITIHFLFLTIHFVSHYTFSLSV